jgi:UDP-N-acetylmuramoylalanine--D-glutamate ligase
MTPATCFADRRVALFGLGGSGLVTARALVAGGADVTCWDDGVAACDKARAAGLAVEDLRTADWSRFTALILTPGVPLTHPVPHWTVGKARQAGIEVIGDIELFCRERARIAPAAPFIAITGTNGKSTTTSLIAHILRSAGRDVQMGGNIGTAILALEPPSDDRVHVIEVSSFQIDLAPSLAPSVGVLLNLTPDHLDRHGTMENYAAVKERLVAKAGLALIGVDDAFSRAIYTRRAEHRAGCAAAVSVAEDVAAPGFFAAAGRLVARRAPPQSDLELADIAGVPTLRGRHNAQNAAFAAAAAWLAGVEPAVIQRAMATYPGLAHRMEQVGRLGRVLFINDSKATNADAAEKALLSFDDIFWILGGKPKEGGIEPLMPLFGKIAKAYLIGAAADEFARTLEARVAYERCGTLDVAVAKAAADASAAQRREPVVLLSPACASYDQFANFEQRGDRFRQLVQTLPDVEVSR